MADDAASVVASTVSEAVPSGESPQTNRLANVLYLTGIGLLLYTWLREVMTPMPGGCDCSVPGGQQQQQQQQQQSAEDQQAMLRSNLEPMAVALQRMHGTQQRLADQVDHLERRLNQATGPKAVRFEGAAEAAQEQPPAAEPAETKASDWEE